MGNSQKNQRKYLSSMTERLLSQEEQIKDQASYRTQKIQLSQKRHSQNLSKKHIFLEREQKNQRYMWRIKDYNKGVRPKNSTALASKNQTNSKMTKYPRYFSQQKTKNNTLKYQASSELIDSLNRNSDHQESFFIDQEKIGTYPYCAIGAIVIQNEKISKIGTACIISQSVILTSAQFCFDTIEKKEEEQMFIYFIPSVNFLKSGQKYKVKQVYYPEKFQQSDDSINDYSYLYDFAFMELQTTGNLQEIYGSIGFDFTFQPKILKKVNGLIIGYSILEGIQPKLKQFQGEMLFDEKVIIHDMNISSGCVGAPILELVDDQYVVRGIHSVKIKDQTTSHKVYKVGVLFKYSMLDSVKKVFAISSYSYDFSGLFDKKHKIGKEGLKQFTAYISTQRKNQYKIAKIVLWYNQIGLQGCKLLKQADWKNLKDLDLRANDIGDDGCHILIEINWPKLESLDLATNKIGEKGCRFLKQSNWSNLKQLNLSNNQIDHEGCRHLKQAKWPLLNRLNLENNQIGSEGCAYLNKACWPNLRCLRLEQNGIGDKGCLQLKQASWVNLAQLHLDKNKIGAQGCHYLKEASWPNLKWLNLSYNCVGNDGCKFLRQGKWPSLKTIQITKNLINAEGYCYLKAAHWQNLTLFQSSSNQIGNEGCRQLKQTQWPCLIYLYLKNNQIGSEGCRHLIAASWPNLKYLNLSKNQIDDEGCKHLNEANWDNLRKLYLQQNKITEVGRTNLSTKKWNIDW